MDEETIRNSKAVLIENNIKLIDSNLYPYFFYRFIHPSKDHFVDFPDYTKKILFGKMGAASSKDSDSDTKGKAKNPISKEKRGYHYINARGFITVVDYYSNEGLEIAKKIANSEVQPGEIMDKIISYSFASFTKGSCIDYKESGSPVWIGAVAALFDQVCFSPITFFCPFFIVLTRGIKIEFYPPCHDSILENDLCLCKSQLKSMNEKSCAVETIIYSKGKALAKAIFFGAPLAPNMKPHPKILEGAISFSKQVEATNFDILRIFSDAVKKNNGDSSIIVDMAQFPSFNESKIEEYSKMKIQDNSNLMIIAGTHIVNSRPIGGGLPVIRHRVYFDKITKKYSAAIHYSLRAEGVPNLVHGGALIETYLEVMTLVSQHIIGKEVSIKNSTAKARSIELDFQRPSPLDRILEIPDVIFEVSDKSIRFAFAITESGKILNKLTNGYVDIELPTQSSKL